MDVRIALDAQLKFERLPVLVKLRMLNIFERLARWPDVSGAKPLRGALAGQYRIRTGDYRVQFRVDAGGIVVLKVGHREGFYDEQR